MKARQASTRHDQHADLLGADYALRGTLTSRYMRCGKPNCRCKAGPPRLLGPYLHWTRTVAGKTVTRTLSAEQARRDESWCDNARRLRKLLTELAARSYAPSRRRGLIAILTCNGRNISRPDVRNVSQDGSRPASLVSCPSSSWHFLARSASCWAHCSKKARTSS